MAASITKTETISTVPYHVQALTVETLIADQLASLAHGGPYNSASTSTVKPFNVTCTVITPSNSLDPIFMSWENSTTVASTVSVRFSTSNGGDLTGAIVKLFVWFLDHGAGGIENFV